MFDPVVEEMEQVKEEIFKQCNYDIDILFAVLREEQKQHQDLLASGDAVCVSEEPAEYNCREDDVYVDPVVEEMEEIKERHARKHNYDVNAIAEALREEEKKHPERLVSFEKRDGEDQ